MPRRLKHARRRGEKYTVSVRVHPGPGGLKVCTMELTATQADIDAWCKKQRKQFAGVHDKAGGLRAVVADYLRQRAEMPALKPYTAILEKWCAALGNDRPPLSVEPADINAVITGWLPTLAADTIHKRRGILFTFYGTMYPHAVNPVKDTIDPPRPEPVARELAYLDIIRAIDSMPTYANGPDQVLNLAKIRLRVLAETGLPPGVLGAIRPDHLDFPGARVFIDGREKGAGIAPRWVELLPDAVEAFKAFHAANAYGPYTNCTISAMNEAFKRACRRVGLHMTGVTQYILRHSFLTQLYREHPDEATVQRLGLHAHGSRVTKRYTKAAHPEIDRGAVATLQAARTQLRRAALKAAPVPKRSQKLSRKVVKGRKSFRRAS
jgi:integrase